MRIPLSKATIGDLEKRYVLEALHSTMLSGDHSFSKKCHEWLTAYSGGSRALLTTSGTHALEMTALLLGIQPGDEVIMPSFTFPSTANSFILRGATVVFVDIRKDTMNLDETLIQEAVTPRTKAVVAVHYGGVPCEMNAILRICAQRQIACVEDTAQGLMSFYKGKPLGSLGSFGCFSFHDTKNITCGEGGALFINAECSVKKAEVLREKGTNRSQFVRGEIGKYTWIDIGSSYLPSDLLAALLFAQLERAKEITEHRKVLWNRYFNNLQTLAQKEIVQLPFVPADCEHNAHVFHLRAGSHGERDLLIQSLRETGIHAAFHYIPLHSSPAGRKFGRFQGQDQHTTAESGKLFRLPLYHEMTPSDVDFVTDRIYEFFEPRLKSFKNPCSETLASPQPTYP